MTKAAVKRKTFLKRVAQIWRRNGSETTPIGSAVDSSGLGMGINLEELQKWREFHFLGDAAEADWRQAKVGSCLREAQIQIEAAKITRPESAPVQDASQ